tara:strand:- start:164 stop:445 length:282 start_codon:yes stop_codon:yes gene_type:complete
MLNLAQILVVLVDQVVVVLGELVALHLMHQVVDQDQEVLEVAEQLTLLLVVQLQELVVVAAVDGVEDHLHLITEEQQDLVVEVLEELQVQENQ